MGSSMWGTENIQLDGTTPISRSHAMLLLLTLAPGLLLPSAAMAQDYAPADIFKMLGGLAGLALACDNNKTLGERIDKYFSGSGAGIAADMQPVTLAAYKKAVLEHAITLNGVDNVVSCEKWKAVSSSQTQSFDKIMTELDK